jgi:hypothetical protein
MLDISASSTPQCLYGSFKFQVFITHANPRRLAYCVLSGVQHVHYSLGILYIPHGPGVEM